jgi:pimeloyl-ACP methyl ester carboxylesterase
LQTGPVSVSAPDIDDDVNGLLGLTTLHEPQEPTILVADIAFIHSLGEGSRKAWSYSPDPRHYWPRSWLPADDEFSNIRIHAFAYKANWGEHRKSILNIHESAQSLFGALRNHPGIRQTSTRIVLVGHGMGGCVAKKTYTLARQDPTAAHLAGRVHSIFFLATPHRGSNLPAVLENMLRVAWGRKRYVTDLAPNAAALAAINDDFRHVAPDLRLWSFFETLPTRSTGGMSRFVVDRHSASLGYHNEEIAALDADHRHVCKFDTLADPNYIVLRNALITAIDLIKSGAGTEPEFSHAGDGELAGSVLPLLPSLSPVEATSLVRSFLGVRVSVEGDLAALQALKLPGSCEWFTKKPLYTSWQTGTAPGILWLAGKLAVGKSVLAGHVIEQLHSRYAYCSYFIFKQSKSGVAALSDCLRSLAFQMAVQDGLVMKALLLLARDELTWDKTDDLTVWRHLFTRCIFKLPSIARHFWVVDGVDECANFDALFTKRLLADLPKELPLFATSRNLHEVERGLTSLGSSRATLQILSDADTVEDMRLFLTTGLTELGRPENAEDRKRMCEKILDKSSGSFLWARLVLQEFRTVWTEEAMDSVLRGIPAGLSELYSRMVQSIEEDRRKIPLAKSILTWVILACRPFTVEELRCAVKLDTNQTLQNAAKAILDLCGQLVFIDQHDKVHMIHETAREFLLDDTLDLELSVRKKDSHTRLASLLLGYLSATALKPVQSGAQPSLTRARGFAKRTAAASTADTSLLQYASAFFSEHLYRATAADHHLMAALSQFLGASSVLAWIEHIASSGDLTPPSRTAMNLREYLGRRMKYVPPTDRSVQLVNGWVTDVIRLAAKFCSELLTCPSSIHSLIPPLCPSESTISQTFGKDSRASHSPPGLVVKGLPPWSWDDCLIRMDFQKRQTTTTRHGDRFFVIGLSTGQISLYDPDSLQVLRQMKHPERVRILEFSHDDILLASCGAKHLVIWDPKSGTVMHSFPVRSTALAISFLGVDEILSAFQSSELTKVVCRSQKFLAFSLVLTKLFPLAGIWRQGNMRRSHGGTEKATVTLLCKTSFLIIRPAVLLFSQ